MKAIQRKAKKNHTKNNLYERLLKLTPANVNSLWKIKPNLLLGKGTEKKFDKHWDTNKYSDMV